MSSSENESKELETLETLTSILQPGFKDGNEIKHKIVASSKIVPRHEMLSWLLKHLNTHHGEFLLRLIPSCMIRSDEKRVFESLRSALVLAERERQESRSRNSSTTADRHVNNVGRKTKNGMQGNIKMSISMMSVLEMIEDAKGCFGAPIVIEFLSRCMEEEFMFTSTSRRKGRHMREQDQMQLKLFEIMLLHLTKARDEMIIIKGINSLRCSFHQDTIHLIAQPTIFHLRTSATLRRTFWNLIMDIRGCDDMTCMDCIALLVMAKIPSASKAISTSTRTNKSNGIWHSLDTLLLSQMASVILKCMRKLDTSERVAEEILIPAMMDLGIHLLFSPVRHADYPPLQYFQKDSPITTAKEASASSPLLPIQIIMTETKEFIVELYSMLTVRQREEMISMLLTFADMKRVTNQKSDQGEGRKDKKTRFTRGPPPSREEQMERQIILESLPSNLRELLDSHNADSEENEQIDRVDKRFWNDARTSSMVILISLIRAYQKNGGEDFGIEVIVNRLNRFADEVWYKRGSGEMITHECTMADLYCCAIVEYIDCGGDLGRTTLDAMGMVERLIGSFWDSHSLGNNGMKTNGRVVAGLMLGKYLIQSQTISESEQELIFEWAVTILAGGDNNATSNATTGHWSLVFLCSLCPEFDKYRNIEKRELMISLGKRRQRRFVQPIKEIFSYIKDTVMKLRLLAGIEDDDNTRGKARETGFVVGYTQIPEYFGEGKVSSRIMFCTGYILKTSKLNVLPCASHYRCIHDWIEFIRLLVDLYLYISSKISSRWSPDALLLACVQVDSTGYEEVEILPQGVYNDVFRDRGTHEKAWVSDDENDMSHCAIVRCMFSYAISLAIFSAVIRSARDHYHDMGNNFSTKRKKAFYQSIKFQLAKFYDIQARFHSLTGLIGFDDDHENDDVGSTLCTVGSMRSLLLTISGDLHFCPPDLLWDVMGAWENEIRSCDWGSVLMSELMINNVNYRQKKIQRLLHALHLQCCVSHHFRALQEERLRWFGGENGLELLLLPKFMVTEGMTNLFQSSREMLLWLQPLKRFYISDTSDMAQLASFKLFRCIHDRTQRTITSSVNIIQRVVEYHPDVSWNNTSTLEIFLGNQAGEDHVDNSLYTSLCLLIQEIVFCEDAVISSQILDLLFFIKGTGISSDELVLKANWHQLGMKGDDGELLLIPPPRSFLHLLQTNLNHNQSHHVLEEANKNILLNLLHISTKTSGDFSENALLRHRLLTHWSLAISLSAPCLKNDFDVLIENLHHTMKRVKKGSKRVRGEKGGKTSFSIPTLHTKSYHVYYEIVLNLIPATILLREADYQTTGTSDNDEKMDHYRSLVEIFICFTDIIEIFVEYTEYFPQTTISSTIHLCKLMIKACIGVLNCSMDEWKASKSRNNRANHLRALVNGIRTQCLDSVENLCDTIRKRKGDFLGRENKKLLSALQNVCAHHVHGLDSIEAAYNLRPSTLEMIGSSQNEVEVRGETNAGTNSEKNGDNRTAKEQSHTAVERSEVDRVEDAIKRWKQGDEELKLEDIGHQQDGEAKPIVVGSSDNEDSDGSFGVLGEW